MKEEVTLPSPAILGRVSLGLAIVNTIYSAYSSYKTAEYRAAVTKALAEILDELKKVEEELQKLDSKLTFWNIWEHVNNPITRIQTACDQWNNKLSNAFSQENYDDVSKAMMQIHEAVCGKTGDITLPTVPQGYLDVLTVRDWDTSPLELMYQYFSGVIVGYLSKGLAFLGVAEKENPNLKGKNHFSSWNDMLINGNTEANEDYLKKPFLQYEGEMFQNVINANLDDISWAGQRREVNDGAFLFSSVQCSEGGNIPNGHVVLGFDLVIGGIGGAIVIKMWHGPLTAEGYVLPGHVGITYSSGDAVSIGTDYYEHTTGRQQYTTPSRKALTHWDKLTVPEGHVVTNMRWHCHGETEKNGWNEDVSLLYFYMSVQHAPLTEGGGIDMDSAAWTDWDPNHDWKDFVNEGDDHQRWIVHWADIHNFPKNWNTPISGVWLNCDRVAFRADIHKNSFSS